MVNFSIYVCFSWRIGLLSLPRGFPGSWSERWDDGMWCCKLRFVLSLSCYLVTLSCHLVTLLSDFLFFLRQRSPPQSKNVDDLSVPRQQYIWCSLPIFDPLAWIASVFWNVLKWNWFYGAVKIVSSNSASNSSAFLVLMKKHPSSHQTLSFFFLFLRHSRKFDFLTKFLTDFYQQGLK